MTLARTGTADFAASCDTQHRPSSDAKHMFVPNERGIKKESQERVDLTDYSMTVTGTQVFTQGLTPGECPSHLDHAHLQ